MSNKSRILMMAWLLALAGPLAAASDSIHFQGRLTDKLGNPISGTSNVLFDLYNAASGGSKLWSSGVTAVTANDQGLFGLELGPFSGGFFSMGNDYFIQVSVQAPGGSNYHALLPRQKLAVVPFAFQSQHAATAESAENVLPNSVSTDQLIDGGVKGVDISSDAVRSIHIKDGEVNHPDLAVNSVRSDNIVDASIKSVDLSTDAVGSSNIKDRSIMGVKLEEEAVGSFELKNGSVSPDDLMLDSITSAYLKDGAITASKIGAHSVLTNHLATGAVTSPIVLDGSIRGVDLEDDTITADKLNRASLDAASLLIPKGTVVAFAGSTPPVGWLFCDGRAVSRSVYSGLFAVIGTNFGAGDGATTFNLPDFRGRGPIGTGQGDTAEGGGAGTDRAMGTKVGAENHTLTTAQMPAHTHTQLGNQSATYNSPGNPPYPCLAQSGTGNTGSTGGGESHNNMQPSLVVRFMIKV